MKKVNLKTNLVYLFSCLGALLILLLTALNISSLTPKDEVLGTKVDATEALLKEKDFWKKILEEQPTYKPGWVELAKIEYQLGNKSQAIKALNTAKGIDPNLKEVLNTEKEWGL